MERSSGANVWRALLLSARQESVAMRPIMETESVGNASPARECYSLAVRAALASSIAVLTSPSLMLKAAAKSSIAFFSTSLTPPEM